MLKKTVLLLFLALLFPLFPGCRETAGIQAPPPVAESDPMGVRIGRLSNGITVYLSPNQELPQVVARIGFRTGGLDDPDDKTGLAHYLEHLLFKGTSRLGTTNFEAEKPLLDRIDALYEEHEKTADPEKREAIYREIDRLSCESARYAASNEFARLIQGMGGSGTNAYTSFDRTVYVNTIPSNQLWKWMQLEAERFRDPVFRGFHTELETVFEEYNMYQDRPNSRFWQEIMATVYAGHPAARPLIGLPEHLKNPSPRRVMDHYRRYYTTENMYIILSGDFQPDQTMTELENTFGRLPAASKPDRPDRRPDPVKGEVIRTMTAPDYELAVLIWRFDRPTRRELDMLNMIAQVLDNSAAGLLDQNLKIPQKVADAFCVLNDLPGVGAMLYLGVIPASGMKPEAARELLDAEIEKLKAGDFPDWLPGAIVDHMRLDRMRSLSSNYSRAEQMLDAAMAGRDWQEVLAETDRLARITPQEIAAFARARLGQDRFVFYRYSGPAKPAQKLEKPPITPLPVNRDAESDFARRLEATPVEELRPEFPNLARDLRRYDLKFGQRTIPVSAVDNRRHDLFELTLTFAVGTDHDRLLGLAGEYAELAGAGPYSAAQFQVECYRLSGKIAIRANRDRTTVSISGLDKNMAPLLKLAGDLLTRTRDNPEALKKLIDTIQLSRKVAREQPGQVLPALSHYAQFGAHSPQMDEPSNQELQKLSPAELTAALRRVPGAPCRIAYFGPRNREALDAALTQDLPLPAVETPPPAPRPYPELAHEQRRVLLVNLPNFRQVQLLFLERKGLFDPNTIALRQIFNEYYGSGMSSVVFQQLREAKSLAYSCGGAFLTPQQADKHHYFLIALSTQADKLAEALRAVEALGFPVSEKAFADARTSLLKRRAAMRWHDQALLHMAEDLRCKGLPDNTMEKTYKDIDAATLEQLKAFYEREVRTVPNVLLVVGDASRIDRKALEQFGPITELTLDQIMH